MMKCKVLAMVGFAALLSACATSGDIKKTTAPLQSDIAALQEQQKKTDQFIASASQLKEALEVGRRVDDIEKKIADVQRKLDDFQTTWDSALREYKTTVDTNVKTFEKTNSQRNAKSNLMMQTAIEKQIGALDTLRADMQKIQSDLRVLAPEGVNDTTQ